MNDIPVIHYWTLWKNMQIKEANFFLESDTLYRVVVACSKGQSEAAWTKFMDSMDGFNLEKRVWNKSSNPYHKYKTVCNVEEFERNLIRMPVPAIVVAAPPKITFTNVLEFLLSPFNADIDLYAIATQFLPHSWYSDENKKLGRNFFMLEAHRKFLVLESKVLESGGVVQPALKQQALCKRYPVVDPITFIIPMLVACANENMQTVFHDQRARLEAAVEDTKDLVIAYEHLASQMPVGFVKDKIYMPLACTALEAGNVDVINHRKMKESRMIQCFLKNHQSAWVDMYLRMLAEAPAILMRDQLQTNLTSSLGATKSMPITVYNVERFLSS